MPGFAEVVFLSQEWAEAYLPRPGEAIISITDRGAPQASLNEGWAAVLRISFDDVDPLESAREPGDRLIALQVHEAESIAAFVKNNSQHISTLVVHCRYGQSRSAGVAKAVSKAFGIHFPASYRYANNFVHELVLNALLRAEARLLFGNTSNDSCTYWAKHLYLSCGAVPWNSQSAVQSGWRAPEGNESQTLFFKGQAKLVVRCSDKQPFSCDAELWSIGRASSGA